ncbi:MAG: hypothetical protein WCG27_10745, partial [Pseudomonadota bacterium]
FKTAAIGGGCGLGLGSFGGCCGTAGGAFLGIGLLPIVILAATGYVSYKLYRFSHEIKDE